MTHRRRAGDRQFLCPICNEPVELETAKTDCEGHVIHDECYLKKISGLIPPKPKNNESRITPAYQNFHQIARIQSRLELPKPEPVEMPGLKREVVTEPG